MQKQTILLALNVTEEISTSLVVLDDALSPYSLSQFCRFNATFKLPL